MPSQVKSVKTAEGSRCEMSRTTNKYVPYPKLRVSWTSAQLHPSCFFVKRRCRAPFSSVQALAGSNEFIEPARKLNKSRTSQSYPLKWSILGGEEGSAGSAFANPTAPRPPPAGGRQFPSWWGHVRGVTQQNGDAPPPNG